MNFQDAENTYRDLRQRHAEGKLTDEEFEAEVTKLWCQDAQGHWWLIGVETGEWYMLDGEKWIKAQPPIASVMAPTTAAPPPSAPTAVAPPPSAPTTAAPTPSAPTTVAPTPSAPTTAAPTPPASSAAPSPIGQGMAVKRGAADQVTSGNVIATGPENVAPVGKGQSTATMVGIIAIVAFVAILILVSGYFIISGVLGGATGRATTTPTRSLALLPTLTLQVPTETPLPPTSEATATEEGTPTRALAKQTATRKPASPTPSGPTATATVNVSPGVYVTNIETIPAQVNLGDTIGFKVSFLNTTGSVQAFNWYVKWYQCPEQCQDFKHSQGESLLMNSNLATGTSSVTTSQNINLRTGISCDLMAVANYVDPVNQLPTPFQATKSSGHFTFTPCH